MANRDVVWIATFAAMFCAGTALSYYLRWKALRLLRRWADGGQFELVSTGFREWAFRRWMLTERPPLWGRRDRRWSFPFRVIVRKASGALESGWVLCHPKGVLAIWDSGRIDETDWSEAPKAAHHDPPLWDHELDAPR